MPNPRFHLTAPPLAPALRAKHIVDGLDVSREMAQDPALKDVPVIMVTSLTGARAQGVMPSGEFVPVDEWIHKPIDPDGLLARIEGVLQGKAG